MKSYAQEYTDTLTSFVLQHDLDKLPQAPRSKALSTVASVDSIRASLHQQKRAMHTLQHNKIYKELLNTYPARPESAGDCRQWCSMPASAMIISRRIGLTVDSDVPAMSGHAMLHMCATASDVLVCRPFCTGLQAQNSIPDKGRLPLHTAASKSTKLCSLQGQGNSRCGRWMGTCACLTACARRLPRSSTAAEGYGASLGSPINATGSQSRCVSFCTSCCSTQNCNYI